MTRQRPLIAEYYELTESRTTFYGPANAGPFLLARKFLDEFCFDSSNPPLQELPPRFLLGQRQRFLIRRPSLSCPPSLHESMPYLSPVRFLPSIITLLNIRLIRVW